MTKEELNRILVPANKTLQQLIDMPHRDFIFFTAEMMGFKRWGNREFVGAQKIREKAHPEEYKKPGQTQVQKKEDMVDTLEAVDSWVKETSSIAPDAQNSLIERFNPEKVQDGTLDNARAYIAKNADSKVQFVFEILSDRRPHHKRDINQAMRDNGWVDDNDCRKYVSQIRDYLALSASHHMIPDCPPGKPAIYQIIKRPNGQ